MTDQPPRTLHDRIFKEFLHRFLPEFLRLFFPDEAARLNFNTLTFLDKELVVNLPGQTLRITDVVAEVETNTGQGEVIIVHIEVEASQKQTLPQRMLEYYALLRILRQKPVFPLALVLLPHAGGLHWQSYTEQLFGQRLLHFMYGQVGVRDLTSETYLAQGEPIAATLATLMQPRNKSKAEIKLAGLQTVINSNLTEGDKLFLMNIIETYLPKEELPVTGDEIMQALQEIEMTWSEKIERKGRLEGELKGKQEVLLHQLRVKFGKLPEELVNQINRIDDHTLLDALSEQVITAETLEDINIANEGF